MYQVKLTKAELKKLEQLKQQEKSKKIFRRLQCIQLRHEGRTNQEIADIVGSCEDTITNWINIYAENGLDGLAELNYAGRREIKITPHIAEIKQDLKENTIATLAELQAWLKEKYSLEIEASWLSRCLKKNSIVLTRKLV